MKRFSAEAPSKDLRPGDGRMLGEMARKRDPLLEDPRLAAHLKAYEEVLDRLRGYITGKILVAPCGRGAELSVLRNLDKKDLTGCECSRKLVSVARSLVPEAFIWQVHDMAALPFGAGEFYTVLCCNGTGRLGDNKAQRVRALRELARLASEGMVIAEEDWAGGDRIKPVIPGSIPLHDHQGLGLIRTHIETRKAGFEPEEEFRVPIERGLDLVATYYQRIIRH
jgi:SAM-dependent methyltransferase